MTTLLAGIFVLGLLVFVHELGHFLAAKRAGVRVERFSLGFPPKMIGKKIGETEYMISWLPLGGYVKLAGESLEEEESNKPYSLQAKSAWVKAIIFAAGPIMNLFLAFLIFWGVFYVRGYQEIDKTRIIVGAVQEDSPAEKAGIKPDDEILALNGERITQFDSLSLKVSALPNQAINLVWVSGGDTTRENIVTMAEKTQDEKGNKLLVGRIGVRPKINRKPVGFWIAGERAAFLTVRSVILMGDFLKKAITREVSLKDAVGGPVQIVKIAGEQARLGFSYLLDLAAFLSVNLALLNLLPIPALDGGHLLFLVIEGVIRRPISIKARAIVTQIGFGLLLLLIVFVTYNDVMRLFQ